MNLYNSSHDTNITNPPKECHQPQLVASRPYVAIRYLLYSCLHYSPSLVSLYCFYLLRSLLTITFMPSTTIVTSIQVYPLFPLYVSIHPFHLFPSLVTTMSPNHSSIHRPRVFIPMHRIPPLVATPPDGMRMRLFIPKQCTTPLSIHYPRIPGSRTTPV